MGNPSSEELGLRLTEVLERAYKQPFTLQSDYARQHIAAVGAAASLGLLTTQTSPAIKSFGNRWRVTGEGLKFIEQKGHTNED